MTKETLATLNTETLIGYADNRGHAWHYRKSLQGDEPNHYPGPIPIADVERRLFDWHAESCGLIAARTHPDGSTEHITDPSRQVIVRSDNGTVLGTFGAGYRIHDYKEWLLKYVGDLIDTRGEDLAIGSAGLLRGGGVAWVQMELPETLSVAGVEFRPYLGAATSLDGSLATSYFTGAQVVVCDNTLSAALAVATEGDRGRLVKVRHSRHSLGKLTTMREALGLAYTVGDEFSEAIQRLTDETVSEARWARFVDTFTNLDDPALSTQTRARATEKALTLHQMWASDPRVAPHRGTAYGVVAAVNTYVHHVAQVRGGDRAARNMQRAVTGQIDKVDGLTLKTLSTV